MMTDTQPDSPMAIVATEITRFNALRHGVLSRHAVLPWEDEAEFRAVVSTLAAEHTPQGPTEENLVEEVAGIIWRKRRLRLAEAAAHRRGLKKTLAPYRETAKAALVHLDSGDQFERIVDAVRATDSETEEEIRDMQEDEAVTRQALKMLGGKRADAYQAALAVLREDTKEWWSTRLARETEELDTLNWSIFGRRQQGRWDRGPALPYGARTTKSTWTSSSGNTIRPSFGRSRALISSDFLAELEVCTRAARILEARSCTLPFQGSGASWLQELCSTSAVRCRHKTSSARSWGLCPS